MEISKELFLEIRDHLVEELGENEWSDEIIQDLIERMDEETGYTIPMRVEKVNPKEYYMEKIYKLISEIRKYEDYSAPSMLYSDLTKNLYDFADKVIKFGKREPFLIDIDGLDSDDTMVTDNRYETIYITDIIEYISEVDAYITPTEVYLKIFEYMVENNIKSYKQDW